jgi:hypothetical protein
VFNLGKAVSRSHTLAVDQISWEKDVKEGRKGLLRAEILDKDGECRCVLSGADVCATAFASSSSPAWLRGWAGGGAAAAEAALRPRRADRALKRALAISVGACQFRAQSQTTHELLRAKVQTRAHAAYISCSAH